MEDFDDNIFPTHSRIEGDAHVSTKRLESIKAYQPGVEATWSITAQLREAAELMIQEAWQQSLLPRVEEEGNGEVDIGPPLDNSTIHWKPLEDGIMLLELFGSIGNGLVVVLQAGIKVKRYIYVDVDDMASCWPMMPSFPLSPYLLVILLYYQKRIFTGLITWTWLL
jgi:hypothetical protein